MKHIFLSLLALLSIVTSQTIPQELVGSYNPVQNKPCPKVKELVLGSDGTMLKKECDASNNEQILFGIFYQTEKSQLQAITSTGGTFDIKTDSSNLIINDQTFQKAIDPGFNINNLEKLLILFSSFSANLPQPREECDIIKTLQILNSGQIKRTFCKDKYDDWYTRGFFKFIKYEQQSVQIQSTVNGTAFSTDIKLLNSDSILYDNKVKLFKSK